MGISVCIIGKNEEKNIERCLKSIQKVADEIIYGDTGSIDRTISIAKKFDCQIHSIPWENDFSKARNFTLDQAKEDWILVIDCDEEVEESSQALIIDLSQTKENIEGFGVVIENIIGGSASYTSASLRLFRNRSEYRYRGIIHEQIGDSINENMPGAYLLTSKIKFIHYGYENIPELEKYKTNRNLSILEKVEMGKRDGLYYLHLGAEYMRLHQFDKASDFFLKSYRNTKKTAPYYTATAHKLADSLYKKGDYETCLSICKEIIENFKDFRSIYFIMFAVYLEQHLYEKALVAIQNYQTLSEQPFKYPVAHYDNNNDIEDIIQYLKKHIH